MEQKYSVSGMTCQSCVAKVTTALSEVPGVSAVQVTLVPPEATVQSTREVNESALQAAVEGVGGYTLRSKSSAGEVVSSAGDVQSLRPLFIIVSYLVGAVIVRAAATSDFSVQRAMATFMGGFFILFSLFKMIDLRGFADAYSTYDLLARRSRLYAYSYPFIELLLGLAYLLELFPTFTNVTTAVLMAIGAVGVTRALRAKRRIQCACLGTALKLPMTKVTLVEDIAMGVMAAAMLVR